jgi:hypothetical protein
MTDFDPNDFFAGLEGDLNKGHDEIRPQPVKERFPCMSCAGTGKWQPTYRGVTRSNRNEQSHCFACAGKGYHNKPYAEAMRDKAAARQKREDGVRNAQERRGAQFDAANPGLRAWMAEQAWSTFIQDMLARIETPYGLSERQLGAVLSTKAKCDARQATKQAERKAAEVTVDLSVIEGMFDTAKGNGLKRPTYRAEGLVINAAPAHGANAGALYVKGADGVYYGKIVGRVFKPTWDGRQAEAAGKLLAIAANPLEAAVRYGRLTNACSCCGRDLTDPVSVARGIGPICAEKWGL